MGHTDRPWEAIGPNGSNCFPSGVRTRISKETYSNWWFFQRGPEPLAPPPPPPLWISTWKIYVLIRGLPFFSGGRKWPHLSPNADVCFIQRVKVNKWLEQCEVCRTHVSVWICRCSTHCIYSKVVSREKVAWTLLHPGWSKLWSKWLKYMLLTWVKVFRIIPE